MGKSDRKKRVKDRANPIAKPIKPPSDPELAAIREKQILPVINDLKSPDTKKRTSAAVAVANLIEDTKCRKLLLREQIVHTLLEQTITDSVLESKSAGWGILRNLALEEEADFCIHLYRQDILTSIHGIVQTILETIESIDHPLSKLPKAQQKVVWTLCASIVGLTASLAEAQEAVVEAITKVPVLTEFLFTILSPNFRDEELLQIDALSCLATLTEDNEEYSKKITEQEPWMQCLSSIKEGGGHRAVAACGLLHNVFSSLQWYDHNTPVEGASDAVLISTLMDSVRSYTPAKSNGASNGTQSNTEEILQLALEITASIAATLQESLEHSSHYEKEFVGFGDETDGNQMDTDEMMIEQDNSDQEDIPDEDGDDDDDEMTREEIEADMALVTGASIEEEDGTIPNQPTLGGLIRISVPTILQLPILDTSKGSEALRDSAISALNNIAWTVSSIDFSSMPTSIYQTWSSLAQQIWTEIISTVLTSNTADITLASSITSLAWALARSVQGQLITQGEEHLKFMALYQASKNLDTVSTVPASTNTTNKSPLTDAFQSLGVKTIGVLGRLALSPAPVLLNREIGIFLLTILSALPSTPPADAVEALNQIFDIYADKDFECDDAVFWKDGFIEHLQDVLPKVKAMAKSVDKRKNPELRAKADEARLNLDRFLKYKRQEKRA